jgi:chromosomal replication initiation ATPase DnaA
MEEIEQLLAKLKQDQEALYNNFKEEVLRAYTGQQKEYKHKSFAALKNIIECVFLVPELFVKTHKDYNCAARSIFDYIVYHQELATCTFIGKETYRDHTTVLNSLRKYHSFKTCAEYMEKYEAIIILYSKYKSNTTN